MANICTFPNNGFQNCVQDVLSPFLHRFLSWPAQETNTDSCFIINLVVCFSLIPFFLPIQLRISHFNSRLFMVVLVKPFKNISFLVGEFRLPQDAVGRTAPALAIKGELRR